jgi:DNA-binding NarL/FixJ family response regulator
VIHKIVSRRDIHKSIHKAHENGPRSDLRGPFYLVALERVCSNTLLTLVQDDAHVIERPSFVSPPRQRRRITAQLRTAVVEAYGSGKTSRQVAEELVLGRTTVLKILKAAEVTVRPQGRR